MKNRDKISIWHNEHIKNRIKTDVSFRLTHNKRRRMHHALNGKSKSSSTIEILEIDIETYRRCIKWQMTPEMNCENVDHVRPISSFDLSGDKQLKEAFNWRNTQPLLKENHNQKGIKYNFLYYRLQLIKSYQFLKLNYQETLNWNFHWWDMQYSTKEKLSIE